MQFEITDAASIAFSRGFYGALAEGTPVDAAVTHARLAIFAEDNDTEWGTPALYLRAPNGVIFVPLSEQERAELEQAQRAREQAERARQQQIETLYLAAQASFAQNDFDAAEKSLAALFALDEANAVARELQTKIQTAHTQQAAEQAERERQQQIEPLYLAAQSSFDKNDFDAAEKSLTALFALDMANTNARELQTKIQTARERAAQPASTATPTVMPERAQAKTSPTTRTQGIPTRYALPIAGVIVLVLLLLGGAYALNIFNPRTATPTTVPGAVSTPNAPQAGIRQQRGTDNAEMVFVPAGDFTMGFEQGGDDEKPAHQVYLDAFWIDQHEVTNAQYKQCVEVGKCQSPSEKSSNTREEYYGNTQFEDYPVIYVSWDDARAYCEWAGKRLPTEAEWEKAARGTNGRIYPWGNEFDQSRVNNNEVVGDTTEVGRYPNGASPYGALDMAGSVWEWVNDWYDKDYYPNSPRANPTGATSGSYRVLRGGSWGNNPYNARPAMRDYLIHPSTRNPYIGFRCAQ
jgi:formylglycine-generating enzyme required for sulfatase activity